MKYMTKKWYNTMQNTSYHFNLNISKNAEKFSEDYFKKLYKKASTYKDFENHYKIILEKLKQRLPKYILDRVSDIRVLALGYASKNVYDKIKQYCEENERYVNKMMNDYDKYYEKEFQKNKPDFLDDFCFHDCDIVTYEKLKDGLIFYLKNDGGFTKINKIIFKNAKIIKEETEYENLWWLYEEIYRINGIYEIHILVRDKTCELKDLIIECTDVLYERGESYNLIKSK